MNIDTFTEQLRQEGFAEITTVEREPGGGLGDHAHPFEAKALIVAGEITITVDGQSTIYCSGEIFHLASGVQHEECYGPAGVRYLVGRR